MSEEINDINLFDDYLEGNLSDEQKKSFEIKLAEDENFRIEFEEHKDLLDGLLIMNDKNLRAKINIVQDELEKEGFFKKKEEKENISDGATTEKTTAKVRSIGLQKILAIAASLLLLAVAGWWMLKPSTLTNQELFANYFQNFPAENLALKTTEKLEELGFAGGELKQQLRNLQQGIIAYENGNLTTAAEQFKQFSTLYPERFDVKLFHGIALLENNQPQLAEPILTTLASSNFAQKETAIWYLALTQLKLEKTAEAKSNLQQLVSNNSALYKTKAEEILTKIK